MGNLFSNKKKNAKELLEDIQNEIDQIETYKLSAFTRQNNYIALLYLIFMIIYLLGICYSYFTFDHNDKTAIFISSMFVIVLPVILYFLRKLIYIYFEWIKQNKNLRLVTLNKTKKKILSKVQETETFNDAKNIFEKYDPGVLRNLSTNNFSFIESSSNESSNSVNYIQRPTRNPVFHPQGLNSESLLLSTNKNFVSTSPGFIPRPQFQPKINTTTMNHGRTIKPILPPNRSVVEKFIDYLFNDGPTNRYALICSSCFAHNGMALPDEFDYISFICAYCHIFNPSRKVKPTAPIRTELQKAIEAPKPEQIIENNEKLKILEVSTEINKTSSPKIEEPDDDENIDKNDKSQNSEDKEKSSKTIEQVETDNETSRSPINNSN